MLYRGIEPAGAGDLIVRLGWSRGLDVIQSSAAALGSQVEAQVKGRRQYKWCRGEARSGEASIYESCVLRVVFTVPVAEYVTVPA